jgi:hypothetical protein
MRRHGIGKQGESPAAPAHFVSFKMDDAADVKKIEPSKKAVAGLTEKVPVIYFVSGQGKGGQHIYILIVECV